MEPKLKTYVLIVSTRYQSKHPKQGEPTYFPEKIKNAVFNYPYTSISQESGLDILIEDKKGHTIRGNYNLWKKRIDEVIAGRAILSIRTWTGKPYQSKQKTIIDLTKENNVGIQKVYLSIHDSVENQLYAKVEDIEADASLLAKNDGLNIVDFARWFFPDLTGCFTGGIIHFTGFRY